MLWCNTIPITKCQDMQMPRLSDSNLSAVANIFIHSRGRRHKSVDQHRHRMQTMDGPSFINKNWHTAPPSIYVGAHFSRTGTGRHGNDSFWTGHKKRNRIDDIFLWTVSVLVVGRSVHEPPARTGLSAFISDATRVQQLICGNSSNARRKSRRLPSNIEAHVNFSFFFFASDLIPSLPRPPSDINSLQRNKLFEDSTSSTSKIVENVFNEFQYANRCDPLAANYCNWCH